VTDEVKRYFTVAEVERLIPRLQDLMGRVMAAHQEAGRVRQALGEAQRVLTLAGGARLRPEEWRGRKARLREATRQIRERLGELLATGGVPKDLELGLVDFPALIDDREVNLCWRYGERRIRFWHGLDEGYAARKPLPGSRRPSEEA
jgi:hypothetical protein